jgi:gp16 family phage-associated protein
MESLTTNHGVKSLDEVRRWFFDEGLTVVGWARRHGLPPAAVYALLAGRTRGRRGQAHLAAIALGLKSPRQPGGDLRRDSNKDLQSEGTAMPAG